MSDQCSTQEIKRELEKQLAQFESPFSWKMPRIEKPFVDQYLISQLEKCENIEEDKDNLFEWTRLTLHLLLSFEMWNQLGDVVCARHHADRCLEMLADLRDDCSEAFYLSLTNALWHVALTTRAYVYFINGEYDLAAKSISEVVPVQRLSTAEKAGLWGIKASVFKQYSPKGHPIALEFATRAIQIDPNQAEWHFIVSNCLGRMRREEKHGEVTPREIEAMKTANILQRDGTYTVHLAQVFVDYAKYIYRNRSNRNVCSNVNWALRTSRTYFRKAIDRFKEAVQLRPYCPALKVRVAHGLLKIPRLSEPDYTFAKQLLDEALINLPNNSMLHFDLACYYEKYEKDPKSALESLRMAHQLGNYPAFLYLVSLRWKYGASWQGDLIAEIEKAMNQYTSEAHTADLFVRLGVAYLLIKEDWVTAVQHFVSSLRLDPKAKYMKTFFGFYGNWNDETNLLDIVTNEIRQKVTQSNIDNDIFQEFLEKVTEHNGHLLQKPLSPGMFAEFKETQLACQLDLPN